MLSSEPSQAALGLAAEALRRPEPGIRESRLARVMVEPAPRRPSHPAIRRVRVDFLRN